MLKEARIMAEVLMDLTGENLNSLKNIRWLANWVWLKAFLDLLKLPCWFMNPVLSSRDSNHPTPPATPAYGYGDIGLVRWAATEAGDGDEAVVAPYNSPVVKSSKPRRSRRHVVVVRWARKGKERVRQTEEEVQGTVTLMVSSIPRAMPWPSRGWHTLSSTTGQTKQCLSDPALASSPSGREA